VRVTESQFYLIWSALSFRTPDSFFAAFCSTKTLLCAQSSICLSRVLSTTVLVLHVACLLCMFSVLLCCQLLIMYLHLTCRNRTRYNDDDDVDDVGISHTVIDVSIFNCYTLKNLH